jgi:hypothetical protein
LAERLAGAEHVDDAAAIDDLHLSGAHHIEVRQGSLAGSDDDGARGEVLHFDQAGQRLQIRCVELVVGRLATEEVDVFTHPWRF